MHSWGVSVVIVYVELQVTTTFGRYNGSRIMPREKQRENAGEHD